MATRPGIATSADSRLRDAILRLALEHEQQAAELSTSIAGQFRGRHRIEALTGAAVCYTLTTDTVRAGIALDIATHRSRARRHRTTPAGDLAVGRAAVRDHSR